MNHFTNYGTLGVSSITNILELEEMAKLGRPRRKFYLYGDYGFDESLLKEVI